MLQVLQNVGSGELALEEVPPPTLRDGYVRVRTATSLISAGTEKMLIELAQKSLLGKAQARPDLVKQVINKVKKEGLLNTYRKVRSKLEKPMPLGYSAAGYVEAVAEGVEGIRPGDRVAIAGAGYANHGEVNCVPKNLVVPIPESVSFDEACYSTVASIALQGVRLMEPQLGDNVVVVGLGLIGLIGLQLLKASGCRVFGVDLDPARIELAREFGLDDGAAGSVEEVATAVEDFTRGRGADHVYVAAATKSNEPVELAGKVARRRGQVVVVGAVGMDIPRDVYYKKELEVKVSMSYGPGRYDPSYEEGGIDYPYDYVRWTEQRNMQAVLDLAAEGKLSLGELTTHRFPFESAIEAYELIQSEKEPFVGVVLEYEVEKKQPRVIEVSPSRDHVRSRRLSVACVGAGNYASLHLIPHLEKNDAAHLLALVTATGPSAGQKAEKFDFGYCTTEIDAVLDEELVEALVIGTRHSTHADFAIQALEAGKHVFVEKPMVVSPEQLEALTQAYIEANESKPTGLMVGLNRRFSPMVRQLRKHFGMEAALQMMYRVNSGAIPTDTWLHRPEEGGGMLIGEMCHFIDVMRYVSGESPVHVYARNLSLQREDRADTDNVIVTVEFDGGSAGVLCYNTVGDNTLPKERLEVYGDGRVGILKDFRRLELTKNGSTSKTKSRNQDKGQRTQMSETVKAFREEGQAPIPFVELVEAMNVVFGAKESLRTGKAVALSAQSDALRFETSS